MDKKRNMGTYLLASVMPGVLLLSVYIALGVYPFGQKVSADHGYESAVCGFLFLFDRCVSWPESPVLFLGGRFRNEYDGSGILLLSQPVFVPHCFF